MLNEKERDPTSSEQPPVDVLALLEDIRNGRNVRDAQERLYLAVREKLLGRLRARIVPAVQSRMGAEDALHTAFVKALDAMDRYEISTEERFFAWIYKIAKNHILDVIDRRSNRQHRFPTGTVPVPGKERRAESILPIKDWVEAALAQLDPKDAQLIRWRHFEELSFEEIGRRLGKAPGAVQRAFSRARERFGNVAGRDFDQ